MSTSVTKITIKNKADIVRWATNKTLKQFSETFKDLARYDRTEAGGHTPKKK